jgi:hypothetical protein
MEALDMRSLVFALTSLCLLAFPAAAQDTCTPFQLVGFTAATFVGATGVLGFTLACQQEFALSRMCTSEEIVNTQTVPTSLAGSAWVRPSFRALAYAGTSTKFMDESGLGEYAQTGTCYGWSSANGGGGLALDSSGSFSIHYDCDLPLSVACCAPVPIAVPEPSAMLMQGSGIAGLLALAKLGDASR